MSSYRITLFPQFVNHVIMLSAYVCESMSDWFYIQNATSSTCGLRLDICRRMFIRTVITQPCLCADVDILCDLQFRTDQIWWVHMLMWAHKTSLRTGSCCLLEVHVFTWTWSLHSVYCSCCWGFICWCELGLLNPFSCVYVSWNISLAGVSVFTWMHSDQSFSLFLCLHDNGDSCVDVNLVSG